MATLYTVLGGTLLNLGVTLTSQGNLAIANGSYVGAGKHFYCWSMLQNSLKSYNDFLVVDD